MDDTIRDLSFIGRGDSTNEIEDQDDFSEEEESDEEGDFEDYEEEQDEAILKPEPIKKQGDFIDIDMSPIDSLRADGDDEDDEEIVIPAEKERDGSYLGLILNTNLRDLELYIRGLEYVRKYDSIQQKEVIKIKKIKDHFLNEKGINAILQELKVHTSSDMTLQRLSDEDYRMKTHEVGQTFHRLIYKNLKEFGMETHEKQRHARRLWLAIKNKIDAAYSRAIGGKENDLSRAQIQLTGEIGGLGEDVPYFGNKAPSHRSRQSNMENMRQ